MLKILNFDKKKSLKVLKINQTGSIKKAMKILNQNLIVFLDWL